MSKIQRPVVIAGAGPVGMIAAADLVRQGIAVLVLEKSEKLSTESRASTFHPPTLDMLDDLGFAQALIAQGLKAQKVQYGSTLDGMLGTFDFSAISDLTRHPYRLQAEQYKLTNIVLEALQGNPLFQIRFNAGVASVEQDDAGVDVRLEDGEVIRCDWLIGADGANSAVRRSQDIGFEGFTWPERFLVVTTSADIQSVRPEVTSVSYWADPELWYFLLRILGAWRVMVPVAADVSDDAARDPAFARATLDRILPANLPAPIEHVTLYRVHQRVASSFRKGRTFLAGDAAHINNPLGGMGMNGGLHDALNLTSLLGQVLNGTATPDVLDAYDRQRRAITMETIQKDTIRNKKNLEASSPEDREAFKSEIRAVAADAQKTREFLQRISMIRSLERAASF